MCTVKLVAAYPDEHRGTALAQHLQPHTPGHPEVQHTCSRYAPVPCTRAPGLKAPAGASAAPAKIPAETWEPLRKCVHKALQCDSATAGQVKGMLSAWACEDPRKVRTAAWCACITQ
jgi:hypothetical protein